MKQEIFKSAILLALFALIGSSTLMLVNTHTKNRIAENKRQLLLTQLNEIVPPDAYDNDLLTDVYHALAPQSLGSNKAQAIYRARLQDKPIADHCRKHPGAQFH
jgi:electron transport complex protein RnfG